MVYEFWCHCLLVVSWVLVHPDGAGVVHAPSKFSVKICAHVPVAKSMNKAISVAFPHQGFPKGFFACLRFFMVDLVWGLYACLGMVPNGVCYPVPSVIHGFY